MNAPENTTPGWSAAENGRTKFSHSRKIDDVLLTVRAYASIVGDVHVDDPDASAEILIQWMVVAEVHDEARTGRAVVITSEGKFSRAASTGDVMPLVQQEFENVTSAEANICVARARAAMAVTHG